LPKLKKNVISVVFSVSL